MDMIRFRKFTIGPCYELEYGNPDERIYFDHLHKYSLLHNVRTPNCTQHHYLATLITTADHDDLVSPLHSLKFTAALQYAVQQNEYQTKPK